MRPTERGCRMRVRTRLRHESAVRPHYTQGQQAVGLPCRLPTERPHDPTIERPFGRTADEERLCLFEMTRKGNLNGTLPSWVEETFPCGHCDSLFSSQEYAENHRRTMHRSAEGPHQCCHCPYSSVKRADVVKHERTHTGEAPFAFTERSPLSRHRSVHTGERPHECATCGKKFAQWAALRRHERTHTGERPHVCGKRKHLLAVHLKEYSHAYRFYGKGFLGPSNLRRHVRKKHTWEDEED
ncbi:hypothetical protein HPB47_021376 [Ixodes persulcatus]|uniref:Uncharacterized protein n=1 Tax=Ixodes persulcatus TaxID=34615 RepID=A0AC60QCP9_IXOPE|nr:hypothetical protein HPB47_021376 [Ixodes persulcatus]